MNAEVYMQVKDDEAANREPASFGETKSEVESGLSTNTHLIPSFNMTSIEGHIKLHPNHRTPIGGRGPRLLWLLCAEGSESMLALSPLPALALAEPVRLRTFMGPFLGGLRALTPANCSTCCGATVLPRPGGWRGIGCRTPPGGDGRPFPGGPM